jgi:diphosphomevalonate decarboxylase
MSIATARVGSNIAFIKYWGVADETLNIPLSNSISMTLADAHTTTTVAWDDTGVLERDAFVLDGVTQSTARSQRLTRHLDLLRDLAGVNWRAWVTSENNFPTASGIASSASGFAALTVAGCAALGLELDPTRLSAIARRSSGSASRSLFGGFVEWEQGSSDETSVAFPLHGPDHWDLWDVVAVVSGEEKKLSSAGGHLLAKSSPLLDGRIADVRTAIAERDLHRLGPIIELDALAMHSVMMTSTPSLLYWQPGTLEILQAVRRWREEDGLAVYFTIDAGPNVHLICEAESALEVETRLGGLRSVERIITTRPGPGPQLLDDHLI